MLEIACNVDARSGSRKSRLRQRHGLDRKPSGGRARVLIRQRGRLGRSGPAGSARTVGRFFRRGYHNNLVASWLPALDGVAAKLERSTSAGATASQQSLWRRRFRNRPLSATTFNPPSAEQARVHAEEHGVTANIRISKVALASNFPGKNLDLVRSPVVGRMAPPMTFGCSSERVSGLGSDAPNASRGRNLYP